MGRPTEERKDRTVKLRISEELYEDLLKRGSNLSETIRKILKVDGSVPQNRIADNLSGLREMAGCFGLTGESLLESVVSGLESGGLTVKDGELVGAEEQWVSDFREACHDKGVPCERVAEKAIQSIKRGLL